ncbi:MAG: excinuclease ABC subunit UvrC [Sodaliphilus sp.]|nr:excinuclease ABC subunit UvrC [Sodaliphilus sp.]
MTPELKLKISLLPDSPGVYMYFNAQGTVIYVGKAKRLKRRVSSYFNRVHPVVRTNMLVRHIHDLKYIVVNTEEEALDLENSLIKTHQPHYNVLLKDDKSYPWICVSKELFPRVYLTREKVHKQARFFGPYPKPEVAWALLDTLKQIYPLRSCRHTLTPQAVESKKIRLCLKYHIRTCCGPCQGYITPQEYAKYIDEITHILNGETRQVSSYLREEMEWYASQLKFEEAEAVKRKYLLLENYRAKSVIVSPTITNIDIYSLIRDDAAAYVNFMHVREGSVVQSMTLEYKFVDTDTGETDSELISTAIHEFRQRFADVNRTDRVREALVNVVPEFPPEGIEFVVPQRGDKRKLLAISLKNAEQYRTEKLKMMEKLNPEQRAMRTLTTIQKDLHLPELPRHIECFDNSNISGAHPVAACVVFRNAKPSKKEYRHFNIKTVEGPDDYASMREVLTRRYSRLLNEGADLPQLVVLDGGKGQLSAGIEVLDSLGLRHQIAMIGIAKSLNEIYFPGDSLPLYIDKNSETLKVVQRLRDEAHRFGIAHHRNKRSKGQVASALDDITGVGEKTKQLLLRHFKSVKRIKEASEEQLAQVVGPAKAKLVFNALNIKPIDKNSEPQ